MADPVSRPLGDGLAAGARLVGSLFGWRRERGPEAIGESDLMPAVGARVDPGVETLRRMATVDRYNDWIYRRIEPYLGQRVLEVGCGIGNMTRYFLGRESLVCLDVLPASVDHVQNLYLSEPGLQVHCADICDDDALGQLRHHGFDTAVCLNVLEHILDDEHALRNMADLLVPGGNVVLFVPAGQYLYGELDRALAHHRRYDKRSVVRAMESAGLSPQVVQYVNPAGIPGWFLASKVLRRHAPPRGLLRLFNLLAPVFFYFEDHVNLPVGLSVLCIARKGQADGGT